MSNNNGKAMNQEIKPRHVNSEQAKLLKEKGFDIESRMSAPEQWQVVEWLRVKYGIWVRVEPDWEGMWWAQIKSNSIPDARIGKWQVITACAPYNSPQEAYSAAFDYILNNNLV